MLSWAGGGPQVKGSGVKGVAMFTVIESATIEQPLARVFDTTADPQNQLKWDVGVLRSVEQLTPGALARGSRYRGDFKGFGVVEYEFAEYEPQRRFAHHSAMKMGALRHTFTFEPVAAGTRVTQEGQLQPNLLGWLIWPLMQRMLRRRFRTIAVEVGEHLASAPQP
jgi:hypothetical protein